MSEDRCIVCGSIIPEGRQICNKCEEGSHKYHCIVCGREIPKPELTLLSRGVSRSTSKMIHDISQLCCSRYCTNLFLYELEIFK